MPVVFGPDPSISSPTAKPSASPTFRTMEVRFKTSRTLVKTFLPPGISDFTFNMPGTLATGSFVQTTFGNVEWLANKSYNTLALHIHGVSYEGSGEQKVAGVYVPIIFEDLPQMVVRDRELYGLPAVYGQVNVKQELESYTVTAGFDGMDWASIVLHDLQPDNARESQTPDGATVPDDAKELDLLAWRSMPSLDGQEQDFAVMVRRTNKDGEMNVHRTWTTTDASVRLGLGYKNMPPTVSHIVERLSEIPIYKILSAKVFEGTGAPSFTRAQRLT